MACCRRVSSYHTMQLPYHAVLVRSVLLCCKLDFLSRRACRGFALPARPCSCGQQLYMMERIYELKLEHCDITSDPIATQWCAAILYTYMKRVACGKS